MIVRILNDGQYQVDDEHVAHLNAIDERLGEAVDRGDGAGFAEDLARLVHLVRVHGTELAPEELRRSDAVLPPPDASIEEVRALLGAHGLVPGT